MPVVLAGGARGRFRRRLADQLQGPVALGVAQIGPQPQDDLRRVAVREEIGEPRLGGARGAVAIEDDGGGEVRVAEAGGAGDPVFGGDGEREFAQPVGRHRAPPAGSSWRLIWITASLRKVAGPETNLTGLQSASSAHGPGIGLAPGGSFPERQLSSLSSRPRLAVSSRFCRSPRPARRPGRRRMPRALPGSPGRRRCRCRPACRCRRRSAASSPAPRRRPRARPTAARTALACLAAQAAAVLNPSRAGR